MQNTPLSDLEVAEEMADAARAAILPYFRQPNLEADNKQDDGFDPVTIADREGEKAMRAVLAQHRPEDGILGEEFGQTAGTSGRTWVLDPIDGTRGFISGTPTWGVLIALGTEAGPFLGVVDQPFIGERFLGSESNAISKGPAGTMQLATRQTRTIEEAIVFTTFPEVGTPAEGNAFRAVSQKSKLTRYGMDCYAYALLAAGQVDLVIEAGLQSYDIQAPIALIQAAGGVVTDWQGNPAHHGGRALAAANAELHATVLEILRKF
ncbi:MAG: histidinol-phosphatase [Ruegeria sp.]